jgi:hypothetical protein
MKTVHALRDVPLPDLTVEDIRVLLSQREGVDVLTPVALDILDSNPLAEGDFYPGDLLTALLGCHSRETDSPGLVARIEQLIERVSKKGDLEQYDAPHNRIWSSIDEWRTA